MALSIRNVYLQNTLINVIFNKNKHAISVPYKNSVRELRGSRLGRELDKTEAKFKQLLKSLKESTMKSIINTPDFPEAVVKEASPKEQKISLDEKADIPHEDVHIRLEAKITPLRKLTYSRQLERKYKKSLNLLRMFGEKLHTLKVPLSLGADKLPCPVELMVPSPVTEGYRNQDEFSFGIGPDGNIKTIGFYLENFADSTKSEGGESSKVCLSPDGIIIIKEIHKEFIKDLQNYVRQSPLPANIQLGDKGYWKSVCVRSNAVGHLMGTIVMHPQSLTKEQLHIEKENLRAYFATIKKSYNLKSLYFQACSLSNCTHEQAPYELLLGDQYIIEELNGIEYQISPGCYFPFNSHSAETLYDSIRKLCRLNSSTTILDIFCGIGPISLTLSPHVKKCIGIDICSQSITNARNNAKLNNLHNMEFFHGNPETLLKSILNQEYFDDLLVVINPAKSELSKLALKTLRDCKFLKKVIYISAKPRSSVQNLVMLCKPAGNESYLGKYFVPLFAVPYDLSPHTEHYGLVLMLQRL